MGWKLFIATLMVVFIVPDVFAIEKLTDAVESLNDLIAVKIGIPVATLGVVIFGILCMRGLVPWFHGISVIVGIVFIFGAAGTVEYFGGRA